MNRQRLEPRTTWNTIKLCCRLHWNLMLHKMEIHRFNTRSVLWLLTDKYDINGYKRRQHTLKHSSAWHKLKNCHPTYQLRIFKPKNCRSLLQLKGINCKCLVKGTWGFMLVFMADFLVHRECTSLWRHSILVTLKRCSLQAMLFYCSMHMDTYVLIKLEQ